MPHKTRRDVLTFDEEGVRELRLTLAFRALEPELSRRLGVPESEPSPIAESSITFGSAKQGSRTVVLKR
jgi:transposase-like protein